MEVKKKAFTLKAVFFKYLLILGVTFIVFAGVYMGIFNLGVRNGVILIPSYCEDLARSAKPLLASTPKITENMIPYGCKFAVFDKEYQVVKTNLEGQDLLTATEYAKGTYLKSVSKKNYYFIEREDGFCVLEYYVQMSYQSEFLNKHLPDPEKIMIITFAALYFFIILIITTIYAKNLNKHLRPLLQATEKIKEQDLDFDIKCSGIKEFNDVLLSISDMKTELKKSLEQQWNIEQAKKEQISALAHDLKTPLTIIKGNAELLSDSTLDKEQQEYIDYISTNTRQIDQYIKTLIDISNSEKTLFLQLERIDFENFIGTIQEQLEAIANTKGLKVEFTKTYIPRSIMIDKLLLQRAIMNVISNAVDYSPSNGKIYFEVKSMDNKIRFITTDGGKGFSSEDIKSATKQFYMGDCSRASKSHYGIGMYITQSFVNLHGGTLHMDNSLVTGGAQVTIEIPICE
ncbi:HAMP domain-containing histidine kinase [Clostridium sp. CM028]|uniref:sensor histidine kinase n=1 Tax=unclassified Clostridium TaxID=2614128 RepID=UPI001C0B7926|nr:MULTISPECIES: HAMP domain-containing sensor histidine kinase [unclassified Clostridium]MBU3092185.1 HAMP domain-containing histidine kinase [Clostridium sp. CF011]MBW9146454.1 HAMP domain-containing histidine kinase [Clostridium sp. CM027]MBW9149155.1 HAMP domain-containing histidine kinase [Clostridium sp. CM028]UVE41956.1 HAMP domain-containing histidine kinase [Clostridium sp. CM027]WAG70974.1 HAMP domain-containing histidine kinase [Clostridium sp. CF011]